jgi:uncharacterized protein (TIGR01319 family)
MEANRLRIHAEERSAQPGFLPTNRVELDTDIELAQAAIALALRRHAGQLAVTLTSEGAVLERRGRDLREVGTIVLTGGIFAHAPRAALDGVFRWLREQTAAQALLLPKKARVILDRRYVLAAAGLLATKNEEPAWRLIKHELLGRRR